MNSIHCARLCQHADVSVQKVVGKRTRGVMGLVFVLSKTVERARRRLAVEIGRARVVRSPVVVDHVVANRLSYRTRGDRRWISTIVTCTSVTNLWLRHVARPYDCANATMQ